MARIVRLKDLYFRSFFISPNNAIKFSISTINLLSDFISYQINKALKPLSIALNINNGFISYQINKALKLALLSLI